MPDPPTDALEPAIKQKVAAALNAIIDALKVLHEIVTYEPPKCDCDDCCEFLCGDHAECSTCGKPVCEDCLKGDNTVGMPCFCGKCWGTSKP